MIKVHGVHLSPFVRKLLLVLEYKGIEYESVDVFPGSEEPEFRAISPLGKIPVLEHDGFTIPDTSVISRYVEKLKPEPRLFPEDPKLEAQACWLEEFADSKLMECCGALFWQRFLNPRMFGKATDDAAVADILENRLPPLVNYLETQVPDSGPLVGDEISIADFSVLTCFLQARYGEYEVDGKQHPRLHAYLDRALAHELVQHRLAKEAEYVAAMAA